MRKPYVVALDSISVFYEDYEWGNEKSERLWRISGEIIYAIKDKQYRTITKVRIEVPELYQGPLLRDRERHMQIIIALVERAMREELLQDIINQFKEVTHG